MGGRFSALQPKRQIGDGTRYENQRPSRHQRECSARSAFASRQRLPLGPFRADGGGNRGRQRTGGPGGNGGRRPIKRKYISTAQTRARWLGSLPPRGAKISH